MTREFAIAIYTTFGTMVPWLRIGIASVLAVATGWLSIWLEGPYESFVRQLCEAQNIRFLGKHVELWVSHWFMFGAALWVGTSYMLLWPFEIWVRIVRMSLAITLLILIISIQATGWAVMRLVECTACDSGIRQMAFRDVPDDGFFVVALVIAMLPMLLWRRVGRVV